MRLDQHRLSFAHPDVAVLEIDLALAQGLDFSAGQCDAGFQLIQKKIIVQGLAIGGNDFLPLAGLRFGHDECRFAVSPQQILTKRLGVIQIPLDGLLQSAFKIDGRPPTQPALGRGVSQWSDDVLTVPADYVALSSAVVLRSWKCPHPRGS